MSIQTFETFEALKTAALALGKDEQLTAYMTPQLAKDIKEHDAGNRKIRKGNQDRITRDIAADNWIPGNSGPMRLLRTGRFADGQHRRNAVIDTGKTIITQIAVVDSTLGCDEGAVRTLSDYLIRDHGFSEADAPIAAAVTRLLCMTSAAGNRDFLETFEREAIFIRGTVSKVNEMLDGQGSTVHHLFKPVILGQWRTIAVKRKGEPEADVDQILADVVNGGATAPEGSTRREVAKQFFDNTALAFQHKKTTTRVGLDWLIAALKCIRENRVRNITTIRVQKMKTKRQVQPQAAA